MTLPQNSHWVVVLVRETGFCVLPIAVEVEEFKFKCTSKMKKECALLKDALFVELLIYRP